jgi:hypothetical protein
MKNIVALEQQATYKVHFTHKTEGLWLLNFKHSQGQFTLWTMNLDQGFVRQLIGCWSCPGTTSVYTKKKLAEVPWRSRSPKYNFLGLTTALTWSNGFFVERGKRGGPVGEGPWQRNAILVIFLINLLFICLNHITARETYHSCLDLPPKLAPTCFTKQHGTSKIKNLSAYFCFCSTNCNIWNLEAINIPLERSWKIPFQRYITRPQIF